MLKTLLCKSAKPSLPESPCHCHCYGIAPHGIAAAAIAAVSLPSARHTGAARSNSNTLHLQQKPGYSCKREHSSWNDGRPSFPSSRNPSPSPNTSKRWNGPTHELSGGSSATVHQLTHPPTSLLTPTHAAWTLSPHTTSSGNANCGVRSKQYSNMPPQGTSTPHNSSCHQKMPSRSASFSAQPAWATPCTSASRRTNLQHKAPKTQVQTHLNQTSAPSKIKTITRMKR